MAAQAKKKKKLAEELLTSKWLPKENQNNSTDHEDHTKTLDIERSFWVMRPNKFIIAVTHYLHRSNFGKKIASTFFFPIIKASQKRNPMELIPISKNHLTHCHILKRAMLKSSGSLRELSPHHPAKTKLYNHSQP